MSLTKEQKKQISDFCNRPEFMEKGGLMTDLDGTVIQQKDGRYFMPDSVKTGLTNMYEGSCPVIINTMRFPLSVIDTFADDWYHMSNASVPLVSLNGSQMGYINKEEKTGFTFEEVDAYPLKAEEIKKFMADVARILDNNGNVLVFYYPRAWTKGEIIWTSDKEKVAETKEKFRSASKVYSCDLQKLHEHLDAEDICMLFLRETEAKAGMTYLQTDHKDFYSHKNVDKLYGAKKMISHLGREIDYFIGAGDTPMDVFLKEVGQAIKVGNMDLKIGFKSNALLLENVPDIGEVFTEVANNCADCQNV